MKMYTETQFSDLAQIGHIHGIKYWQILDFEFQLYKLSFNDY